jgi:hypothetical protein
LLCAVLLRWIKVRYQRHHGFRRELRCKLVSVLPQNKCVPLKHCKQAWIFHQGRRSEHAHDAVGVAAWLVPRAQVLDEMREYWRRLMMPGPLAWTGNGRGSRCAITDFHVQPHVHRRGGSALYRVRSIDRGQEVIYAWRRRGCSTLQPVLVHVRRYLNPRPDVKHLHAPVGAPHFHSSDLP